jgi:hypothetical protein
MMISNKDFQWPPLSAQWLSKDDAKDIQNMPRHTTLADETLYCNESIEPISDDELTWPNQPFGD